MLTKELLIQQLSSVGFKSNDTVMIHSSLKSIGEIEGRGEGLVLMLKEFFRDGLLIFPTHAWATIREDNQVFDVENTPSCVGMLTEIARKTEGFKRSHHPTHSVCACGVGKEEYLKLDDFAVTPVGVHNCFGVLPSMNAKILFIGAPLSKNTFVHSIEEELDIPERFTAHIYHFITKDQDKEYHYDMPRHYSRYSPHISDHYEKLLEPMITLGIASSFKIGEATSIVVDARKCHDYVVHLLNKDRHLFDDFRPIPNI